MVEIGEEGEGGEDGGFDYDVEVDGGGGKYRRMGGIEGREEEAFRD